MSNDNTHTRTSSRRAICTALVATAEFFVPSLKRATQWKPSTLDSLFLVRPISLHTEVLCMQTHSLTSC